MGNVLTKSSNFRMVSSIEFSDFPPAALMCPPIGAQSLHGSIALSFAEIQQKCRCKSKTHSTNWTASFLGIVLQPIQTEFEVFCEKKGVNSSKFLEIVLASIPLLYDEFIVEEEDDILNLVR